MKNKNTDKIYTYIVLLLGILICVFYFYSGDRYSREVLTSQFNRTNYERYFDRGFMDNKFIWITLQILFFRYL